MAGPEGHLVVELQVARRPLLVVAVSSLPGTEAACTSDVQLEVEHHRRFGVDEGDDLDLDQLVHPESLGVVRPPIS